MKNINKNRNVKSLSLGVGFRVRSKKLIAYIILSTVFVSCTIPKDGEQENIATSKLEMLTNLGNDTAKVATDTTAKAH